MEKLRAKLVAKQLSKFAKISKQAQSFAADHPLWSSIIFEKDCTRYVGWRFQVECHPPIIKVDEPVIVNFDRLLRSLSVAGTDYVNLEITKDRVIIHEDDVEGATFELIRLDADYSNFIIEPPEGVEPHPVHKGFKEDVQWATIACTKDRMDYMKYGVILDKYAMIAMDSESAVAYIDKPTGIELPVLLHLPWCQIIAQLGEVVQISQWDEGEQNAYLYILTEDGFNLTIPTLKVYPNPSVESYIKSLEAHMHLFIDPLTVKQLDITTDDAYKFVTLTTEDGVAYMESTSKTKGSTSVSIGDGEGLDEDSVTISLPFLTKMAKLAGQISIDLDNMVGFYTKNEYTYAFGLG